MRGLKSLRKETKHSGGGFPSTAVLWNVLIVSLLFALQNMKDTASSQEFIMETRDVNSDIPMTTLNRFNNNKKFSHRKYSPTEDRSLLAELTQSPLFGSLECPPLTTPIYDRIINEETNNNRMQKIPKICHLSFTSRCISRPLQNTFAIEPQHSIAVFTMESIMKNLIALESLRKPKTVFVTGPQAPYEGCQKYTGVCNKAGIHTGKFLGKKVHLEMYVNGQWWGNPMNNEIVECDGWNLTKKEQSLHLGGLQHWDKVKYQNRFGKDFLCREYLYRVDHPSKKNNITGNWSLNEDYAFGVE